MEKETQVNNRGRRDVIWIDVLKGMGILLVVLGHSIKPDGLMATAIFSFHMPLFFSYPDIYSMCLNTLITSIN